MTNTCSKCQYWRKLSSKPICTNMKSVLFNSRTTWVEICPSFVKKDSILVRFHKGVAGLKCSNRTRTLFIISALFACETSMVTTLLYLVVFKGVVK